MLSRRTRLGYYGRTGTVLQRVMLWVCGFVCPSVPKVARLTSITDENVPQRSVYCQISGAGSLAVARTADFLLITRPRLQTVGGYCFWTRHMRVGLSLVPSVRPSVGASRKIV